MENLEVQTRTNVLAADVGYWYGKLRFNNSGKVIAQDYYGFEKQYTTSLWIFEEIQIVDKKTGNVVLNLPGNNLQNVNVKSNPSETLELKDANKKAF